MSENGVSTLYRARHSKSKLVVALKLIHLNTLDESHYIIMASCIKYMSTIPSHAKVANIKGIPSDSPHLGMVLECVPFLYS